MKNLESKVVDRLEEVKKSKADLAEYLDVSIFGLTKMLKRGTLKSDYMLKIAKFLNVDINFLGLNSKENSDNILNPNSMEHIEDNATKVELLKQIISTKDAVIESQKELIATLKSKLQKE